MASAAKNLKATATVRIAPVERWCEGVRKSAEEEGVANFGVGREVTIFTTSMSTWNFCDGRVWTMTMKDTVDFAEADNRQPRNSPAQMCEHMLEMD